MSSRRSYRDHSQSVQAWLKSAQTGLSSEELIDLFGLALSSVWTCAREIVSDITLLAVLDRVVAIAQEDYAWVPGIPLKANHPDLSALRTGAAGVNRKETLELVEFLLTEFIAIQGAMTAEVLTPRVNGALRTVRLNKKNRRAINQGGKRR